MRYVLIFRIRLQADVQALPLESISRTVRQALPLETRTVPQALPLESIGRMVPQALPLETVCRTVPQALPLEMVGRTVPQALPLINTTLTSKMNQSRSRTAHCSEYCYVTMGSWLLGHSYNPNYSTCHIYLIMHACSVYIDKICTH